MKTKAAAWLFILSIMTACKKTADTTPITTPAQKFHKDIIIHENVNGNEQPQNALGLYAPVGSSTFLFTASRGMYETEAKGFRIGGIENDEVKWIRSYSLPASYSYQYATCSAMDGEQNIWIGGHIFGVPDSYGRPFLVKLDKTGNILQSRYFNIPEGPNKTSERALSLKSLKNGDLAFLTITSNGLLLYRINPQGMVLWARTITTLPETTIEDPFKLPINVSSINRCLAESPEEDLYIAFNSNYPIKGKDFLVKLNSLGTLQFVRSYRFDDNYASYPAQLICTPTGTIFYANQKWYASTAHPYIYLLSSTGSVGAAKALPQSTGVGNPFAINELNYFNNQVHLTTTMGYQFADYTIDLSLVVRKSGKVLGTNTISTERGGTSIYDKNTNSLYHILDIAGATGDGNGFQFIKTDNAGNSCHGYQQPPEQLVLENFIVTMQYEMSLKTAQVSNPSLQNLDWDQSGVTIAGKELVCSE